MATQLLAGLYTDDRPPAQVLRKLALGLGARLPAFRRSIVAGLTAAHEGRARQWVSR
jgi:hypothetical protein